MAVFCQLYERCVQQQIINHFYQNFHVISEKDSVHNTAF